MQSTETLLAQIVNPALPTEIGGVGAAKDSGPPALGNIISSSVGVLLLAAFALTFLYLAIGGISWVTSSGDKARLESARNKITHAIIGIIIVGASWAIFMLVVQFMGLEVGEGVIDFPLPTLTGGE